MRYIGIFQIFLSQPACLSPRTLRLSQTVNHCYIYRIPGTTFTTSGLGLQLQNFLSILEKRKRCSDFRTFTVLYIGQKLQEFNQNLIDIHSAKCH